MPTSCKHLASCSWHQNPFESNNTTPCQASVEILRCVLQNCALRWCNNILAWGNSSSPRFVSPCRISQHQHQEYITPILVDEWAKIFYNQRLPRDGIGSPLWYLYCIHPSGETTTRTYVSMAWHTLTELTPQFRLHFIGIQSQLPAVRNVWSPR